MPTITISKHPLVLDALTQLRDKTTPTAIFRANAEKISRLLITEAAQGLPLSEKTISTPLTATTGSSLQDNIVLMTILRAGLAMLGPALTIFPNAPVGFFGLARDEKTAIADEYYQRLPVIAESSIVFLLDPMLATGGSLLHVLKKIDHAKEIRLVTIISAPEGIAAVTSAFPNVRITTGFVDEKLNDRKFIVPGLGDFGDRFFGTE